MDINKIRNETLYCEDKIFLNSAGSSLSPTVVNEAVRHFLSEEETRGGYQVEEDRQHDINDFYHQAAILLNCKAENIAFAHDATDAYSKALSSIPFEAGDVIITSNDDYSSNQIQFLSLQNRYGIILHRINNLENGDIDLDHCKLLVEQHRPKLVAITHIPTNSGKVQDVKNIGELCADQQIIYLVDACQSVGQLSVDVQEIKCDFLSATGRKFLRGPRGTGLLYVSDRILNLGYAPLFIDGRGATWTAANQYKPADTALRFQMWEAPYAMLIGLAKAINYANQIGIKKIEGRNKQIMNHLRSKLAEIKEIKMYDRGSQLSNILTFRHIGLSVADIQKILDHHQVYCSISTREWGVIDFDKKGVESVIRLSPHYFNTIEEMDRVAQILSDVLSN